jgi:hypothetical protein
MTERADVAKKSLVSVAAEQARLLAAFIVPALLVFPLLFVVSALVYFPETSFAGQWRDMIRALPEPSGQQPGTRVLVEGRVAADAKPVFQHFVAFVEEAYNSGTKQSASRWALNDARATPFAIETQKGRMELEIRHFWFTPWRTFWKYWNHVLLPDWDHIDKRLNAPAQGLRYRGLVPGGPVVAIGTLNAERKFTPEFVMAGTRQSLLDETNARTAGKAHQTQVWFMIAGVLGTLLTALVWAVAVLRAWRARGREPEIA